MRPMINLLLRFYPPRWRARYGDVQVSQFNSAQMIADKWKLSREQMEVFALESHTRAIPGPVTHVWIDGGRHDLKGADPQVAEAVVTWAQRL